LPLEVSALCVDLLSLGGHKLYGPKGVGALYIRDGIELVPQMTGGGQESDRRAGTHNVAGIVGFAEALHRTELEREQRRRHVEPLRDRIIGGVLESVSDSRLTGAMEDRLPNHASFAFLNVDGNLLLTLLDLEGYACSSIGVQNRCLCRAMSWMRLTTPRILDCRATVGRTSAADIDGFLAILPGVVERSRRLRGLSGMSEA
jgi:cysteine desulfurase